MKIPSLVPIDDDTVIIIDGIYTITWAGFLKVNAFEPEEVEEMRHVLHQNGEFRGGGGAAAEFHLTLLTHRVVETKLQELRRIRVNESIFFERIDPECLTQEIQRIAAALGRTFVVGGVKLGARIRRTA